VLLGATLSLAGDDVAFSFYRLTDTIKDEKKSLLRASAQLDRESKDAFLRRAAQGRWKAALACHKIDEFYREREADLKCDTHANELVNSEAYRERMIVLSF
jgi:hypothetical protein